MNIAKFNLTTKDLLTEKMIVHLNVLCLGMKDGVSSELYVAYVFAIDQNQGRYLDLAILQHFSKPDSFIGGKNRASIFSLSAQ